MRPYHRKLSPEPTRVLVCHANAAADAIADAADALVARIGGMPILRVLTGTSPYCRQAVAPLARELSLRLELCPLLDPGADADALARFLDASETENAVLCTDRETLAGVVKRLVDAGPAWLAGPAEIVATWILLGSAGGPRRLRYLRGDAAAPCAPRTR
jgi:hypothetical protein